VDLGPAGRVVLVTGGADGLGLATADRLAAEGAFLPSPGRATSPGQPSTPTAACPRSPDLRRSPPPMHEECDQV